jgi:hypothetical protein
VRGSECGADDSSAPSGACSAARDNIQRARERSLGKHAGSSELRQQDIKQDDAFSFSFRLFISDIVVFFVCPCLPFFQCYFFNFRAMKGVLSHEVIGNGE